MEKLEHIVGKELENASVNTELVQEFIDCNFKDAFAVRMHPTLTANRSVLDAEVVLAPGTTNLENFVISHSMGDKADQISRAAQRIRNHILENCSELVFTTTYTDPSPSNRKRVVRFHEFENRGRNMRTVWLNRVSYYSGGIAALVTAGLAYNQAVASQPLINIGQQTIGWLYIPMLSPVVAAQIMKRLKTPHRIWERTREYLGKEKITEDETVLDQKYESLRPEMGVYSGQSDRYRLYNSGSNINLMQWQKNNPRQPLFNVIIVDSPPSSLVWVVDLDAKIGGQTLSQSHFKAYQYRLDDRRHKKSRSFIDGRYAKEVHLA